MNALEKLGFELFNTEEFGIKPNYESIVYKLKNVDGLKLIMFNLAFKWVEIHDITILTEPMFEAIQEKKKELGWIK